MKGPARVAVQVMTIGAVIYGIYLLTQ